MEKKIKDIAFEDIKSYMVGLDNGGLIIDRERQEKIVLEAKEQGFELAFVQNTDKDFHLVIPHDMSEPMEDELVSGLNITAAKGDPSATVSSGACASSASSGSTFPSCFSSASTGGSLSTAGTVKVIDSSLEHFTDDANKKIDDVVAFIRGPDAQNS